jgi:hypothetical protein
MLTGIVNVAYRTRLCFTTKNNLVIGDWFDITIPVQIGVGSILIFIEDEFFVLSSSKYTYYLSSGDFFLNGQQISMQT